MVAFAIISWHTEVSSLDHAELNDLEIEKEYAFEGERMKREKL